MDIVLGVSMAPSTVRMVLVEGVKADGVTVDHDAFDIAVGDGAAKSSADQVIDAILGTRESAAEGGHRLTSFGVAWTDHDAAAELKGALRAHKLDDVILVSELHAAGALAQAVGRAVGYERTALLLLDGAAATLAVVETATGAIVKVQTHELNAALDLVANLETLDEPPQGLFIVGSGADVSSAKALIAQRTGLPVHAPEEPELALARGAALASASTPRYEASTVGLPYEPTGEPTQMAAGLTQRAEAGYMAPLGYSAVDEFESDIEVDSGFENVYDEQIDDEVPVEDEAGRKPFLLVGSALASVFVVGVVALVISLSVSIRPTVDQRPAPGAGVIAPTSAAPALVAPQAQVPEPAPAPAVETIQAPQPVVQEAPRTVYVTPAPQAPAQVIATPPPAATPGDAPAAPPPVPVPAAPAPVAPPVVVIPAPIPLPLPIFQAPGTGNWPFPSRPQTQTPQTQTPQTQTTQTQPPETGSPTTQQPEPTTQQPQPTQQPTQQEQPTQQQQPTREQPATAATTQAPSSSSSGESSSGSRSSGSGSSRSGTGSSRGSSGGSSGGGSSSGGSSPLWPWPSS